MIAQLEAAVALARRTSLLGKTALITGAARGVGAATARRLIAQGANVALVDIDEGLAAETARQLGPNAAAFPADVRDAAQVVGAVAAARERFGHLDVVIANAGVITAEPFQQITPEAFRRTLDVNVLGVWHTIDAGLPALAETGGYLLVVASLVATANLPFMSTYDASKAAVAAFANAVRFELRIERRNVDLGVAYFSVVDTDLVREAEGGDLELGLSDISYGPVFTLLKPERVGRAVVRAVRRRSRRTVVPWYYYPALSVPGITHRFIEIYFRTMLNRKRRRNRWQPLNSKTP